MKKTIIYFTLVLLTLASCREDKQEVTTRVDLEKLTNSMLEDPIAIEYYTAVLTSFTMISEGDFTVSEYHSIAEKADKNHCNINKEAFNGNVDMENFSKQKCFISKITPAFRKKYPVLKELNEDERLQISKAMTYSINPPIDIEARKRKTQERFNQLSAEEKKINPVDRAINRK